MKKVGIIRCRETEDLCQGTPMFKLAALGASGFEAIGPAEVVGFVTCGGCPGKRAATRAEKMVERGAEVIMLASCIKKGCPVGMPCPHFETLRQSVARRIGAVQLLDWSN